MKLQVNILHATKLNRFYACYKTKLSFTRYKNWLDFYKVQESYKAQNQVDFYKVQKWSQFLASKLQKPSRFLEENRLIKRHNFESNGTPYLFGASSRSC